MNHVQNITLYLPILTFAPDTVFVDFEIAIHKAMCTVWTEAEIKGCRFHLG